MSAWIQFALNAAIFGAIALAGVLVYRRQSAQNIAQVQERVIAALREENAIQEDQIERLRRTVERQTATIATIRFVLKKRGISIRIEEDTVVFTDTGVPHTTTTRISKDIVTRIASHDDGEEEEDTLSTH